MALVDDGQGAKVDETIDCWQNGGWTVGFSGQPFCGASIQFV